MQEFEKMLNLQIISHGLSHSYMWELISKEKKFDPTHIKAEFSVSYKLDDSTTEENKLYQFFFDISDYQVSGFTFSQDPLEKNVMKVVKNLNLSNLNIF